VFAIAAVGNPDAFFGQLEALGARVTRRRFPDHHAFTRADITAALSSGEHFDYVVCTLKDAVKMGPLWPADNSPLWYVSLAVQMERGEPAIDALLMRLQGRIDVR
jgi:tetraacyldisaccharide 4'-kinase